MKKPAVLALFFAVVLFIGCAPSLKTEKIEMPKASNRGSLTLVVNRSSEDVTAGDASRTKQVLSEEFQLAGFSHVDTTKSTSGAAQSLEITITKYEHLTSTRTGCVATAVGCIVICPCVAPCCALLPGYQEPQFEILAEVSAHKNGRLIFTKVMSEKSMTKANLVNSGNKVFKDKLEELTLHNFAVALVTLWDKK